MYGMTVPHSRSLNWTYKVICGLPPQYVADFCQRISSVDARCKQRLLLWWLDGGLCCYELKSL